MDDAISRQEVLKLLSTMPQEDAMTKAMLIQSVKQMDAAQPERKKGKWIERWHDNQHVIGDMACSVCGAQMLLTFPRFCPCCGAYMREEV